MKLDNGDIASINKFVILFDINQQIQVLISICPWKADGRGPLNNLVKFKKDSGLIKFIPIKSIVLEHLIIVQVESDFFAVEL